MSTLIGHPGIFYSLRRNGVNYVKRERMESFVVFLEKRRCEWERGCHQLPSSSPSSFLVLRDVLGHSQRIQDERRKWPFQTTYMEREMVRHFSCKEYTRRAREMYTMWDHQGHQSLSCRRDRKAKNHHIMVSFCLFDVQNVRKYTKTHF